MAAAPDLTEPLVGYRAWRVGDDGSLVPWSAVAAGAWVPGVNTARCLVTRNVSSHVAPMRRCSCGLYALANPRDRRLHADGQAVGAIVAWGDIELHATGFRAEKATIVALGLPTRCSPAHRDRLRRASERYGVPLVAMSALPAAAGEYGRALRWEDVAAPARGHSASTTPPGLDDVGAVGVAPNHHVQLEVVPTGVRVTLTTALADEVPGRVFVVPEPGTEIRCDDVLAQAESDGGALSIPTPLSGRVVAVADGRDPRRRMVELVPTRWLDEARAVSWAPDALRAYAAQIAHARTLRDPFLERRTTWLRAHSTVRSPGQVLEALRAAREAPRFASESEVYEQIADRLRVALEDRSVVGRVIRMPIRILWRLHDPEAEVAVDLTGGRPVVRCGASGEADLVVFLSAETADRYFAGRVDLVAALRRREIQCAGPVSNLLLAESVLKVLKPAYAALAWSDGTWAQTGDHAA